MTTDAANARGARHRAFVHDLGTFFAYVYVLRVPLLVCAATGAMPLVALPRDAVAGPLLRGLFDVADPGAPPWVPFTTFAFLTFAGLMAAATIAVTARLILLDGGERFGLESLPQSEGIQLLVRLLPLSAAALLVGGAWYQSWGSLSWIGAAAAALGSAVSVAGFVFLMTVVHDRLWAAVFVRTDSFLTTNNAIVFVAGEMFAIFAAFVRLSPVGFVDRSGRILARHAFALLQFLLSLLVYVTLWILKSDWISRAHGAPRIPTLCLVLVLGMLACWALTGLTFVFDRYRVPLLTLLVAYGTVMSVFPWSDHFFQTVPHDSHPVASLTASAVLAQRAGRPAIVVAAAGGGIQAAAWTARVMQGLQADSLGCGDGLDGAIAVFSAVSGGSVGAMYVVDAYRGGRLDPTALVDAVAASEASSLDEVAWGLTGPDLLGTLAPFVKRLRQSFLVTDRGSALEDAWTRTPSLRGATLDQWRADLTKPERERPAVLFNATVAETGQRMLLATTTLETDPNDPGRREFAVDFSDRDLRVTTAARLSATFPYVSPAARIDRHAGFDDQFHYVDGGYYDNYGTATAIEWLDAGLRKLKDAERPSRVLLLEIRSFPDEAPALPNGAHGWTQDALQPLETLYAVRGTGQQAHSDENVKLMVENYTETRIFNARVTFPRRLVDDRDDASPPLSWHLTAGDRGRLAAAWHASRVYEERVRVHNFMRLDDDPISTSCIVR